MASPLPRKLWEHPNPENTSMANFRKAMEKETRLKFNSFKDMHEWSVTNRAAFWDLCWRYFPIVHQGVYAKVFDDSARIDRIPHWFKGVHLNYAENILFTADPKAPHSLGTQGKEENKVAIIEAREWAKPKTVTWGELRIYVGRLSAALRSAGVRKGNVVAAVVSNSFDALCIFLSTTALGGIFTSASPDMGSQGILDRLLQVSPKLLFFDDSAGYNGKTLDLRPKLSEIAPKLQGHDWFHGVVTIPRYHTPADVSGLHGVEQFHEFVQRANSTELCFERVDFGHPFLIVYSSGTTGAPKCIAHSTGGVILAAYREGSLHRNLGPESIMMQFTTTAWIMYLISINSLLLGSTCVLYDGNPFFPAKDSFIRLASELRVTHLGISPRYLHEIRQAGIVPRQSMDLGTLENVTSTGMVLSDSLFEWFYDTGFPKSTQLANISGGTDIAGCFALENPLTPVYVGGCQGPVLGIDLAAYEQEPTGGKTAGRRLPEGVAGELVAVTAFPNMPAKFWGQLGPEQYHSAYFSKFDNVWSHGDLITIHPITRQITFLGRADGVLNPSGVRFGSAEIYSIIETDFPQVEDSICVGRRRQQDPDESVILFLKMKQGELFTEELATNVKHVIRKKRTARHVPKFILPTPEIPMTPSLKKVEVAVKNVVSGQKPKTTGLLNPKCLEYYWQFYELEEEPRRSNI